MLCGGGRAGVRRCSCYPHTVPWHSPAGSASLPPASSTCLLLHVADGARPGALLLGVAVDLRGGGGVRCGRREECEVGRAGEGRQQRRGQGQAPTGSRWHDRQWQPAAGPRLHARKYLRGSRPRSCARAPHPAGGWRAARHLPRTVATAVQARHAEGTNQSRRNHCTPTTPGAAAGLGAHHERGLAGARPAHQRGQLAWAGVQ